MSRKNRAKSSSLFLLELILAILFFSIASAVCVQIFVKSHLLSADAQALNLAVSECSGVAEIISASDDEKDAVALLQETYPDGVLQEPADDASQGSFEPVVQWTFHVYYDDSLQLCPKKNAVYQMTVCIDRIDTMLSASIEIQDADEQSIYQLAVEHHVRQGVENTGYPEKTREQEAANE